MQVHFLKVPYNCYSDHTVLIGKKLSNALHTGKVGFILLCANRSIHSSRCTIELMPCTKAVLSSFAVEVVLPK